MDDWSQLSCFILTYGLKIGRTVSTWVQPIYLDLFETYRFGCLLHNCLNKNWRGNYYVRDWSYSNIQLWPEIIVSKLHLLFCEYWPSPLLWVVDNLWMSVLLLCYSGLNPQLEFIVEIWLDYVHYSNRSISSAKVLSCVRLLIHGLLVRN